MDNQPSEAALIEVLAQHPTPWTLGRDGETPVVWDAKGNQVAYRVIRHGMAEIAAGWFTSADDLLGVLTLTVNAYADAP